MAIDPGSLQDAIFRSAHFSCIATDVHGTIKIFNRGAERMFGYAAAEVLDLLTPADLHDVPESSARAAAMSLEFGTPIAAGFDAVVFKAARGIEDVYELTWVRKDGSRFPAVVSVMALRDAHEAIIGFSLIGNDNTVQKELETDRRKLDQRLRDEQFYTRSLIESNVDALMTTDPRGIIIDVNKQMATLSNCTRDELIGAPFKNHFTDPARAEAGIQLALSNKRVVNYDLVARARNGRTTEVSCNATTFYDRNKMLQGVFVAARDITERSRAENKFRSLIESLPDALVIVNQSGEIVLVNSQTERMFGYPRSELLGQKVDLLLPARHHGRHSGHREGYFSDPKVRPMGTGGAGSGGLDARRKDGTEFRVEISLSPLETEERMVSATIRDITTHRGP